MGKQSIQYWLRCILLVLVTIGISIALPVVMPLIVAIVLTLILWPLVNLTQEGLQRYWKDCPRWIAIIPSFVIVILLSFLLVRHVIVPVIGELTKLLANLPYVLDQFALVVKGLQGVDGESIIPHQFDGIINSTLIKIGNYGVDLAQRSVLAIVSLASTLLQLLLVPILTFYLLKDGRDIKKAILGIFSKPTSTHLEEVVTDIHRTLGGYLRGQLLLATNMFCLTFIACYVYDLPYPLVLAVLAGIAEWIPIIGPFLSAVPAIILGAVISGPLAVKVAITYGILQLLDGQIIMPKIMGHVIKLPPLVIITAIFVGGYFFGIIGMMVAVPVTATTQIIAKRLWYFNTYYRLQKEEHHG